MLKADFHVHTKYSGDSSTSLEQVIRACQKKNINCVAIADHNEVEGALLLQKMAPFKVIVAEEILTTSGEIMGMFLTKKIPRDISIEEAIERIREQGGLVCTQHPFDKFRSDALQADVMERIKDKIDMVEIFNARTPLQRTSDLAREWAGKHGFPATAGSDAHAAFEIGNAWVEMPDFSGRDDFLSALRQGTVYGHKASFLTHFASLWARIKKLGQ